MSAPIEDPDPPKRIELDRLRARIEELDEDAHEKVLVYLGYQDIEDEVELELANLSEATLHGLVAFLDTLRESSDPRTNQNLEKSSADLELRQSLLESLRSELEACFGCPITNPEKLPDVLLRMEEEISAEAKSCALACAVAEKKSQTLEESLQAAQDEVLASRKRMIHESRQNEIKDDSREKRNARRGRPGLNREDDCGVRREESPITAEEESGEFDHKEGNRSGRRGRPGLGREDISHRDGRKQDEDSLVALSERGAMDAEKDGEVMRLQMELVEKEHHIEELRLQNEELRKERESLRQELKLASMQLTKRLKEIQSSSSQNIRTVQVERRDQVTQLEQVESMPSGESGLHYVNKQQKTSLRDYLPSAVPSVQEQPCYSKDPRRTELRSLQRDLRFANIVNVEQLETRMQVAETLLDNKKIEVLALTEANKLLNDSLETLHGSIAKATDSDDQIYPSDGRFAGLQLTTAVAEFNSTMEKTVSIYESSLQELRHENRLLRNELAESFECAFKADSLERELGILIVHHRKVQSDYEALVRKWSALQLKLRRSELPSASELAKDLAKLSWQHQDLRDDFHSLLTEHVDLQQEFESMSLGGARSGSAELQPSIHMYDCHSAELGPTRIVQIHAPGRKPTADTDPSVIAKITPLANGVAVELAQEQELPETAKAVLGYLMPDTAPKSWTWMYEPSDGNWALSKCWGLAHGVLMFSLAKVVGPCLTIGSSSDVSTTAAQSPALEMSPPSPPSPPKKETKAKLARKNAVVRLPSQHLVVLAAFEDPLSNVSKIRLLRDAKCVTEDGGCVEARDSFLGLRLRGPDGFVEVRSIQRLPKQQHQALTLHVAYDVGMDVVEILGENSILAQSDPSSCAQPSSASDLQSSKHHLFMYSLDGVGESGAIKAIKKCMRTTSLVELELDRASSVYLSLSPSVPKTSVEHGVSKEQFEVEGTPNGPPRSSEVEKIEKSKIFGECW